MAVAGLAVVVLTIGFFTPDAEDVTAPAEPLAAAVPADLAPAVMPAVSGREFYASPAGDATNPGTLEAPVDLATALSSNTPAAPGDVIWLRGGTYEGSFTSVLSGTESEPIFVRQYPGEHAVIDSSGSSEPALTATGRWTWYVGFQITNSNADRSSDEPGETPTDLARGVGVSVRGENLRFLNLVIHEMAKGIHIPPGTVGPLVAGSIIYNNGWDGAGNARGVGIEGAREMRTSVFADNIVFNQGAGGIRVFNGPEDELLLEGNVVFNNGLFGEAFDRNILAEGGILRVNRNYTYFRTGRPGGENNIGYTSGCAQLVAHDNYWAHRAYPLVLTKCPAQLTDNVLIGPVDPAFVGQHGENTYHRTPPAGLDIFVQPSLYEDGRAHIVVFNWDNHPAVGLDLTRAVFPEGRTLDLPVGTPFEIYDALNYTGKPVVTGTYSGTRLSIPMKGLETAAPVGDVPNATMHPGPEFGVFVLRKGEMTAPAPQPTAPE